MANDFHEIDDAFKNRFDGLKDRSVDPSAQWALFEEQLTAADAHTSLSASKGSLIGFKTIGIAASLIALISAAGLFSVSNSNKAFESRNGVTAFSDLKFKSVSELDSRITSSSNRSKNSADFTLPIRSTSQQELTKSLFDGENQLLASHNKSNGNSPSSINLKETGFTEVDENVARFNARDRLAFMNGLNAELQPTKSVESRSFSNTDFTQSVAGVFDYFIRGGVRFGNGESNTTNVPNDWTANFLGTVGASTKLSNKIGVMVEIGYLRKSGNGLERNQNLEISNVYNAFHNSFANNNVVVNDANGIEEFTVDKSIVAQKLDFVHIPVSAFYTFSNNVSLNAGSFVDVLFNVQNKAYTVYNGTDYVTRFAEQEELKSKAGLRSIRLGVSAGATYSLSNSLSFDLRANMPLNSAFNDQGEICASKKANQPLDLMFSLRYTI